MLSFNTKKGEELKVPYHASAAVTRDGNLPPIAMQYILATVIDPLTTLFN